MTVVRSPTGAEVVAGPTMLVAGRGRVRLVGLPPHRRPWDFVTGLVLLVAALTLICVAFAAVSGHFVLSGVLFFTGLLCAREPLELAANRRGLFTPSTAVGMAL